MNFRPRPRQACQADDREPPSSARGSQTQSTGPRLGGAADALQAQDSRLILNRLFLSGILAAEPQRDKGRDGAPVTLLLIAFPAPDPSSSENRPETASCEIEVPDPVTERHGKALRTGDAIFITGQLSGGGGVIATEIHSGPAP